VARSLNHYWYGTPSIFIVFDVKVTGNNLRVSSVDMERQKWVPFALFWSYKIFVLQFIIIRSMNYYECTSIFLP
jgi:hypothetical protein